MVTLCHHPIISILKINYQKPTKRIWTSSPVPNAEKRRLYYGNDRNQRTDESIKKDCPLKPEAINRQHYGLPNRLRSGVCSVERQRQFRRRTTKTRQAEKITSFLPLLARQKTGGKYIKMGLKPSPNPFIFVQPRLWTLLRENDYHQNSTRLSRD